MTQITPRQEIGKIIDNGNNIQLIGSGKAIQFKDGSIIAGQKNLNGSSENFRLAANIRNSIQYTALANNANKATLSIIENSKALIDLQRSINDPAHITLSLKANAKAEFRTNPEGLKNIVVLNEFASGAEIEVNYAQQIVFLRPSGSKYYFLDKKTQGHKGKYRAKSRGKDFEVFIDDATSGSYEEQWGTAGARNS
jgi:hypothetical protein